MNLNLIHPEMNICSYGDCTTAFCVIVIGGDIYCKRHAIDALCGVELAALRARVGELEQERDELLKSDSENCDEFNAGFDAYKAGLDLDNSEEFYRACKREEGIPSYDSFSTGYVWAKFTTERAALAKGAK